MRRIADWAVPRLAWLYLNFVGQTSKVHWINSETKNRLEKDQKSFIYAFWHGRQVFLAWSHRYSRAYTLVSQSKDGGYIAEVLRLFHKNTVRGSSSRGGARALIALKKVLDRGKCVGITPDGPRGPQRKVAPGVLYLAQKTGKSILPAGVSYRRKLVFKGWDEYWVPLPFNWAVIQYGNPVTVGPQDSIEQKAEELAGELNRVTDEADALCREPDPVQFRAPVICSNAPVYAHPSWTEKGLYALYNVGLVLFSPLILAGIFLRYPKTFLKHFGKGLSCGWAGWNRTPLQKKIPSGSMLPALASVGRPTP